MGRQGLLFGQQRLKLLGACHLQKTAVEPSERLAKAESSWRFLMIRCRAQDGGEREGEASYPPRET